MTKTIFTFPEKKFSPQTNREFFGEKRFLFDHNKTTPTQTTTPTTETTKKPETTEKIVETIKTSLTTLKRKVDGAIDTDAEKKAVDAFLEEHKQARLSLKNKVSGTTATLLGHLNDTFALNNNKESLIALKTLHKAIIDTIEADTTYLLENTSPKLQIAGLTAFLKSDKTADINTENGVTLSNLKEIINSSSQLSELGKANAISLLKIMPILNKEITDSTNVKITEKGWEVQIEGTWKKLPENSLFQVGAISALFSSISSVADKGKEAIKSTATESIVSTLNSSIPEKFEEITETTKKNEIIKSVLSIYYKTTSSKELIDSNNVKNATEKLFKNINLTGKDDKDTQKDLPVAEGLKNQDNIKILKEWITNELKTKIEEKKKDPNYKKGESLYISINEEREIVIVTETEKKKDEEVSTDGNETLAKNAYDKVAKKRAEYKAKFTGTDKIIAWFFKQFLGVDITDPLASGGLVKIGRFLTGVPSPGEDEIDNYDLTKDPELRKQFLTDQKDVKKILNSNSLTEENFSNISKKEVIYSKKAKEGIEKAWAVGGKDGTGQKAKNMMADVIRKFEGTQIIKGSKDSVTFQFTSLKHLVQAKALLQQKPGSMEAITGLVGKIKSSASGILGGIDMNLEEVMGGEDSTRTSSLNGIENTQKNLGYPDISSAIETKGNKLTVSWDIGTFENVKEKFTKPKDTKTKTT
jgi:hypothetical protein